MEPEKRIFTEILEKLLEISREQIVLLRNGRFAELMERQAERERLFGGLQGLETSPLREDEHIRALAEKIVDNDSTLALSAESMMGEMKTKLGHLKKGARALKAYSAS